MAKMTTRSRVSVHAVRTAASHRKHRQPVICTAPWRDVMRRIRKQTGSARVVFAMLNQDRSRLRTRLALGGQTDDGLRRLDLDLGSEKSVHAP